MESLYLSDDECKNILANKEIYIFGAGLDAEELQARIGNDTKILAYIDNYKASEIAYFCERRIISLEQCLKIRKKEELILVSSHIYAMEICQQLSEVGLVPCQDFYVWDAMCVYHHNEETREFISLTKEILPRREGSAEKKILVPFARSHLMNRIRTLYCANYFAEKLDATLIGFLPYHEKQVNVLSVFTDIYEAWNVKECVQEELTVRQIEEVDRLCSQLWTTLDTWEDWNNIVIYDIPFGATIVSNFLRRYIPTFELKSEKMYAYLKRCIEIIVFWYQYIYENDIVMVFLLDAVTIDGFIRDIALTKGIPTYCVNTQVQKITLGWYAKLGQVAPNLKRMWEQLSQTEQEYGLQWAQRQIEKRINGGTEEVWTAHKDKYTFAEPIKANRILEENDKIKIIIFPHIFEEDCLCCGEQIFDNNYFTWLCHLGELSERTPQYDWYLKMHPNAQRRDFIIMDEIYEKYPTLKRIESSVSPWQLKQEGAKYALTVYGSIGHEFPQIGIQVIHAGCNPHCSFDFTWNPRTKEEYDELIYKLDSLDKQIDMNELYKFYSLYYLFYDWNYPQIKDVFGDNPLLQTTGNNLKLLYNLDRGPWIYKEFMKDWTQEKHNYIYAHMEELFRKADEWKPDILYKKKINIKQEEKTC